MEYDIIIDLFSTTRYYKKGTEILHREDGPAVEYDDGYKEWLVNGRLHRVGGPAVETANGNKQWWFDGKLHRTNGPAIEHKSGYKEWWINDKQLSLDKETILNEWWDNKNGI